MKEGGVPRGKIKEENNCDDQMGTGVRYGWPVSLGEPFWANLSTA